MGAQFLRYPGAKVAVFDRGRSFMVACLALGGDWIELGRRRRRACSRCARSTGRRR